MFIFVAWILSTKMPFSKVSAKFTPPINAVQKFFSQDNNKTTQKTNYDKLRLI